MLKPIPDFLCWRIQSESAKLPSVDEGRKRVLLIAASILAARKLAQYDAATRVPATISAISDAVRWAEQIMAKIVKVGPVDRAFLCGLSLNGVYSGPLLYLARRRSVGYKADLVR